jgi:DNA mismatch endonuclease (patch repair protein)
MAASGIDTKGAATRPSRQPGRSSGAKFDANVARDSAVRKKLLEDGWRVATVWECALRKTGQVSATTDRLAAWLFVGPVSMEIGESDILQSGIVATDEECSG